MAHHFIHFQKRLACISGAILLAFAASTAHADVFGGSSDDKSVKELTDRLAAIEAKIESLKQAPAAPAGPAPVAEGGAPVAPPEVTRAQDLDILAEPPYVVLGKIDGMHLVRKGDKRILLTDKELKAFEAEELVKARKRIEQGGDVTAGLKLPSPPPPPPVSANVAKDNAAVKQAEAAAKPVAPQASKYAAKPANNGGAAKK